MTDREKQALRDISSGDDFKSLVAWGRLEKAGLATARPKGLASLQFTLTPDKVG